MQIKPHFDTFRILEEHEIVTDDTGNKFSLMKMEARLPSSELEFIETSYVFWRVLGRNKIEHSNGCTGLMDTLYWRAKKRELLRVETNGFRIEEFECGEHLLFVTCDTDVTLRYKKDKTPQEVAKVERQKQQIEAEKGLRTMFRIQRL